MAQVDDILVESATCDFIIEGGDIKVGKSDQQHVEHIIRSDKGHWRQWPLIGVGIDRFQKGPVIIQEIIQLIKLQLKSDNYNVREVRVSDEGQISIDAERIF